MLPETIDDVLDLAGSGDGEAAGLSSTAEMLQFASPCLVLLARDDGTVVFADDFGSGGGSEVAAGLAHDLTTYLRGREACTLEVEPLLGARLLLALRLPENAHGGLLACLVGSSALSDETLDAASTATIVASAFALAAARHKAREAELSARVEQLTAGQEALRASYTQSLTDAIEEHEERLREQETAQKELRRLNACNKLILDSAGEGIVGLDDHGKVTFVNPVVERLVGWTSDEMVGKSLHTLVHHAKPNLQPYPPEECPVCRTLREGTTERVEHEFFWRKDGRSFPVEYVATPMREDQAIVGAVVTFQDITDRKVLEGQLVQAQKLESIGQLAAGIAHEINTPTQFIGDNLRFLEDAFSDLRPLLASNSRLHAAASEGRVHEESLAQLAAAAGKADLEYLVAEIPKALTQSLEGVGRVATIVRSMKEFSHPGSDDMQPVDLNRALESTLTVCRNEWKYLADAVTNFAPALPLVTCLPGACNQVFLNLIINAAHAIADKQKGDTTDRGTITVSTRCDGDWVEIRVADTGTGIPEQFRTKVLDPFFTTKEVGRGTGQGLAIARSVVVDKHGGELSFETEIGRGTTFIVRLPRSQQ